MNQKLVGVRTAIIFLLEKNIAENLVGQDMIKATMINVPGVEPVW